MRILEQIACRVVVTGKPFSDTCGYGSDLMKEIREVDVNNLVGPATMGQPFVFLYNGVVPIKISCKSSGLQGYFVTIDKATKEDENKFTVYK